MKWKAAITVLVCLFVGFALGVSYERLTRPHFVPEEHFGPPGAHGPGRHMQRRMERMARNLELSEDQQRKIEQVFRASHERMKEMRSQIHPRFLKLREETLNQIREVLTPEQQQRFDQIHEKQRLRHERRWKERGRRWGHSSR